ncbi:hypothetical protein BGZ96_000878 [Linnemannia gamsii]|uniref:Uncharacterized protein n=1 Tax=Linnemannia gamsii TaxID=64522 RepID=A0ABQ7JNI2_9FUNG|nr:hypothetical protein BGZ96_000878 [Linnemannia gamsii]
MSYQQAPPPHLTPPPPSPPPASEYWNQYHENTNIQPNPPVLSFRAFHATHFSWPQRQAFFGGGAPEHYYHHPWLDSHSPLVPPVATDTLANPSEPTWDPYHDLAHHHQQSQQAVNEDKATTATAVAGDDNVPGASMFGLSQEAIEIFEFSRRFREEKRAALAEERARMARRRTKRRRLTRRGFAPDEGNSGSDDEPADLSEATDNNNNINKKKKDDLDDSSHSNSSSGSSSENESRGGSGGEEEEDDEFVVQSEPPATDVTFLTQPSRQRDRTRQKLYGLKKSPDTSKDKEMPSSTTSDEMWSIRMLEAMLNQTFIESLGGPETTTENQNNRRRSRYSSGKGGGKSQQQSQLVYWPGMPMRC